MEEQELTSSKSKDDKGEFFGGAKKLCEKFISLQMGDLFTYSEIFAVIGRDPQASGRSVCLRASNMALRDYGIMIVCEKTIGYRRVQFEGRREWIVAKGDSVRRLNVRRFMAAAHIEQTEWDQMTAEEKQKLADEQARSGMALLLQSRLEQAKKLPPVEKIKLVDLSGLSKIFGHKKTA